MDCKAVTEHIVEWLKLKAGEARVQRLIIGVSGGVDSAITSTLAAKTGLGVTVLNMPIHQNVTHVDRSNNHIAWLQENFDNIQGENVNLSKAFDAFVEDLPISLDDDLANANSRSRLRMVALYAFANTQNGMVVGTGNKVEDHGVRFFTKYGDGGVDISPIADLTKSQVFELGRYLGVADEILDAPPSDGLWDDERTDEDQIGASYDELEVAMNTYDDNKLRMDNHPQFPDKGLRLTLGLTPRAGEVLRIFAERHEKHAHKMEAPPACLIPKNLLTQG